MKLYKCNLYTCHAIYLLIVLSLTLSPLQAEPNSPSLPKAWLTNIAKISEQVIAKPDAPRANQAQIDASLRIIKASLAAENYQQAIIQLHVLHNYEPIAAKPILELSEQLADILAEKSKKEIARAEQLYKDFSQAILAAKVPEDIDHWLHKFSLERQKNQTLNRPSAALPIWSPIKVNSPFTANYKAINHSNQLFNINTSNLRYLQSKSRNALQIARYWQDYLHYIKLGSASDAKNSMRSVANIITDFSYIPRSKILELQSKLNGKNGTAPEITKHKLADLKKRLNTQEDAVILYHELARDSSTYNSPAISGLKSNLQEFHEACEYLEGGNINEGFYKIRKLIHHPLIGPLCRKTHDKFMIHYLKVPADFKQLKNEHCEEWATRYILKLSADKDWKKLHPALLFMHKYYNRSYSNYESTIGEDLKAVRYLRSAKNYEANKQYMRAIVAYRQAIGSIGYCTEIVEEAGKQILKLQKNHPTEYAQSESLHAHDGTFRSYTTSHLLIRKIVKEELSKKDQPVEKAEE